jgi:hypothetical protein
LAIQDITNLSQLVLEGGLGIGTSASATFGTSTSVLVAGSSRSQPLRWVEGSAIGGIQNPLSANFLPGADLTYNLGSSSARWTGLYISDPTIYGIATLVSTSTFIGNLALTGNASLSGNLAAVGTLAGSNLSGTNTGDVTLGSANGLVLASQQLGVTLAGSATSGTIGTSAQSFAGAKTFLNTLAASADLTVGSAATITGSISASNLSGTNTGDVTLGSANGLVLSNQQLGITLAGSATSGTIGTGAQTFTGAKTFLSTLAASANLTVGSAATITGSISASNLSGTNTGDITIGSANGLVLSSQQIGMTLAGSATTGTIGTAAQTFTGAKTFLNTVAASADLTVGSNVTITGTLGVTSTTALSNALTITNTGVQNLLGIFRDVNAGTSTNSVGVRLGNSGAAQGYSEWLFTNAAVTASPKVVWTFTPRNNAGTTNTDCVKILLDKTANNDGGEIEIQTASSAGVLIDGLFIDNTQTLTFGTGTAATHRWNVATASTVGAAGGASALPATPSGYMRFKINGTTIFKVPYYAD